MQFMLVKIGGNNCDQFPQVSSLHFCLQYLSLKYGVPKSSKSHNMTTPCNASAFSLLGASFVVECLCCWEGVEST